MELKRMGVRPWWPWFRWWNSCAHFIRQCSISDLCLSRKTPRIRHRGSRLQASQYNLRYLGDYFPLVWLVWCVLLFFHISLELKTHYLGFNGGSALAANLRAAQACIVTNLAASVGGLTWMVWVSCRKNSPEMLLTFCFLGLPYWKKVVCRWVLLWCYCWPCGYNTRIWICRRTWVTLLYTFLTES